MDNVIFILTGLALLALTLGLLFLVATLFAVVRRRYPALGRWSGVMVVLGAALFVVLMYATPLELPERQRAETPVTDTQPEAEAEAQPEAEAEAEAQPEAEAEPEPEASPPPVPPAPSTEVVSPQAVETTPSEPETPTETGDTADTTEPEPAATTTDATSEDATSEDVPGEDVPGEEAATDDATVEAADEAAPDEVATEEGAATEEADADATPDVTPEVATDDATPETAGDTAETPAAEDAGEAVAPETAPEGDEAASDPDDPGDVVSSLLRRQVEITMTSDPPGATVFLAGARVGQTPITFNVPQGEELNYSVIPEELDNPEAYERFIGTINAAESRNISVYLERTGVGSSPAPDPATLEPVEAEAVEDTPEETAPAESNEPAEPTDGAEPDEPTEPEETTGNAQ